MARRRTRKPGNGKPVGGGGARHPNSLSNLVNAPAAPAGNTRTMRHGGYATVAAEAPTAICRASS